MKKCLILFMMIIISSVALWAEYTGVGTFEKIDEVADIESGSYYVFYGIDGTGTGAMTNIAGSASNTLANTDVTLADGNFVDPDASVVWLVTETATGEYTVYNEAVSKYAEITVSNNRGCTLNANSSHTYTVSVHATYGFIFLCSSGAGVNRHLSIYLDQDWRSYTSATMKKLHLYKLTGGSTTTVATPTFDPIAGTYYQTKNVTISSATTGATIYYTTNGDTPTTSSTQYSAAISITATTTVKALAVKDGYTQATAEAAYVITDAPTVTTDLFFSEYIEGSSNNKAIEIYNGTGVDVVLTDNYSVKLASNANNFGTPFNLTGTLVNGEVLVIANSQADGVVLAVDHIINGATAYNGDDAIGLYKNSALIDIIGVEGSYKKQDVAGVTAATENHTLVRKSTVTQGNTNWTASAGTSAEDSEWIVYDEDTFDYLGFHVFTGGDTNTPPTIANIVQLPETNIISTSEILVTADVTDSDGTISEVKLHWGTSSESLTNTIDMTLDSGDTYWVDEEIPAQLNNTTVYYQITAKDNDGAESTSGLSSYTVANLKADFTANRTIVSLGQTVTFTSTTTGGVKPYTDYLWDFGDDTEDSIELSPTHSYSAIGKYTVTLYVGDTAEDLVSVEKVNYIEVVAAFINPAKGTLYISEVSDAPTYTNEYIELYNNSSDVLSLDKTKLLMLKADGTTESTFNLNNLSYDGDRVILPHNYIIITRGGDRETFETEFDSPLPEGVSFLKGSTGMYFGASTARRWQLVLDTGSKEVITIDDTKDVVGGSNKTSYQDSPGHWTT
ncbi:MAG: chitobiase/beta-hexosaminidase C-terminal domain-containing protein, partial [Candidatus Cloacimonadales bacterium]